MHCGFDHAPFKTQQACVDSCVQEQCSYYPTYVVGPDTGYGQHVYMDWADTGASDTR